MADPMVSGQDRSQVADGLWRRSLVAGETSRTWHCLAHEFPAGAQLRGLSTLDQVRGPAGDGGLGEFRRAGATAQIVDQCPASDPATALVCRAHSKRAA